MTSASSGVPSAAAPATGTVHLSKLKPVLSKPFPEGSDEAAVCEAIDSTMPDLWVRFGHLVPAYLPGAIYVLETGPQSKVRLYDFILRKYTHGYHAVMASCRGSLTLLYIRSMYESSEYRGKPFGRQHLSQELERQLGIKTKESFLFVPDERRLSEYCRADAELCEALIKLDPADKGQGLCGEALTRCSLRNETAIDAEALMTSCKQLPATTLACLAYRGSMAETLACRETVVAALCP